MNRKQIIAELRRSATEDFDPWMGSRLPANDLAETWMDGGRPLCLAPIEKARTFYLLVACALEDEQ